jgi:DNA-binding XRE family transcriptional regulator
VPTDVVATDEFVEWYDDLDDRTRKSVMRAVDLLEQMGTALKHPHSSQIKGSRYALRELRVQSGGHPIRVFYIFDMIRQAVLLVGGGQDRQCQVLLGDGALCRGDLGTVSSRAGEETMKVHKWKDIRDRRLGPEEKAQVRVRAAALRQNLGLRAIRESLGMTQNDVAEKIEVDQGQLSRFERGQDMRLSTLGRYLGALGYDLEIAAVAGKKRIVLRREHAHR